MCRIFGALGWRDIVTTELVSGVIEVMEHGGPNGQG